MSFLNFYFIFEKKKIQKKGMIRISQKVLLKDILSSNNKTKKNYNKIFLG